jgi:hypothetical protein
VRKYLKYFIGWSIVLGFLFINISFLIGRELISPSTITYEKSSIFPHTTSGHDWRENYFQPFFWYSIALDVDTALLSAIFLVIPSTAFFVLFFVAKDKILKRTAGILGIIDFIGLSIIILNPFKNIGATYFFLDPFVTGIFFLLMLLFLAVVLTIIFIVECIRTQEKKDISLFFINIGTLLILAILLFISFMHVNSYILNTRYTENAKVIRLAHFAAHFDEQNNLIVTTIIESDIEKGVAVWGGIQYEFTDNGKTLFYITDYPQTNRPGFNYSISPGQNNYTSVLKLSSSQYEQVLQSKDISVEISFIGQDAPIVNYLQTIEVKNLHLGTN